MDLNDITRQIDNITTASSYNDFHINLFDSAKAFAYFIFNLATNPEAWETVVSFFFKFSFFYPLVMAYIWMVGAIYYYYHWEKKAGKDETDTPVLKEYPPVSILVPCHNEAANIEETISYLENLNYPEYEIIAINDASTDDTLKKLIKLTDRYSNLRVVNLEKNQGKATGLNIATLMSRHEFLICIDADAILSPNAITWMMSHFVYGPRVGAVTGNPRIRTRSTVLGKIQVGEFSAIIGLIKRAQRIYGRVFTVSGVVAAFRKKALHRVGYWSDDMVTEDIDISWKLQLDYWQVRFEPHALCWILMPETFSGLFKQRLRWAQGGAEVMFRYASKLMHWKSRRMWVIYMEYVTSIIWSYTIVATATLWGLGHVINLPPFLVVPTLLPSWGGVILGITCLLQFFLSLLIESRYEKNILKYFFWIIWYPVAYWMINAIVAVLGFPRAMFRRKGNKAIWISPDRGVNDRMNIPSQT